MFSFITCNSYIEAIKSGGMRWLKVIKINSDKECMIAISSFYYFFCICLNLINAQTKILDDEEMYFYTLFDYGFRISFSSICRS